MRATHEHPGLSHSAHGGRSGNAEIHELDRAIGCDHDVLGLDVTVDDAILVSSG